MFCIRSPFKSIVRYDNNNSEPQSRVVRPSQYPVRLGFFALQGDRAAASWTFAAAVDGATTAASAFKHHTPSLSLSNVCHCMSTNRLVYLQESVKSRSRSGQRIQ